MHIGDRPREMFLDDLFNLLDRRGCFIFALGRLIYFFQGVGRGRGST